MKVAAVIVTFNRKELLVQVIESVIETGVSHIYIIDNNSSDGTEAYLKENVFNKKIGNKISYEKLSENTGGAGGFYTGIKTATETKKYDWLWLMDDDICPEKNTLNEYKKIISTSTETIGALMGLRFFENKPFSFECKAHDFTNANKYFKQDMLSCEDFEREIIKIADFPFEGPLINTSIIDKIGYPNKDFFIIGDDTDYAIRINQIANVYMVTNAKFNRLITPHVDVENYSFDWKYYYSVRNITYLNKKYGENAKVKYLRNLKFLLTNIKQNTMIAIKQKKISNIKKTKYIWQAYYHGMTGKLGKTYVPGDF